MFIEANRRFEELCAERHAVGQQEYGDLTFLNAPTVPMAMEECADISNYSRYTFIRLFVLERMMNKLVSSYDTTAAQLEGGDFIPLSEIWKQMTEYGNGPAKTD